MPRERGGGGLVFIGGRLASSGAAAGDSGVSTVLDADGNPLVVSAVVQYRICDTFRAAIQISDISGLIYTLSEATLKKVVGVYPYDAPSGTCLRRNVRAQVCWACAKLFVSHAAFARARPRR